MTGYFDKKAESLSTHLNHESLKSFENSDNSEKNQ
jgi:hypothetical protein